MLCTVETGGRARRQKSPWTHEAHLEVGPKIPKRVQVPLV